MLCLDGHHAIIIGHKVISLSPPYGLQAGMRSARYEARLGSCALGFAESCHWPSSYRSIPSSIPCAVGVSATACTVKPFCSKCDLVVSPIAKILVRSADRISRGVCSKAKDADEGEKKASHRGAVSSIISIVEMILWAITGRGEVEYTVTSITFRPFSRSAKGISSSDLSPRMMRYGRYSNVSAFPCEASDGSDSELLD